MPDNDAAVAEIAIPTTEGSFLLMLRAGTPIIILGSNGRALSEETRL